MNNFTDDVPHLRLAVQRAFLGRVVPSIRAITVEINQDHRTVWVFSDGAVEPETLELLSEAETELLADYPDNKVALRVVQVARPASVPRDRGVWVYARYEVT